MLSHIRASLVMIVGLTLITGIVYPLAMTEIAQTAFPNQANGSLVVKDGKIVGASLIGQSFTTARYFHGRPSATTAADPADDTKTVSAPYNAQNSGGSNLAPTSKALIDRIGEDARNLHAENPDVAIPVDLVTTSASGLDPDITPAAAYFQVPRVAAERHVSVPQLRQLIATQTQGRLLWVLGEPRVNVLALNLALDKLSP